MRGTPSFHRINYSVRTNKSIERKLLFERLSYLKSVLPINDYRYVGFGSMWFVDFVLAHRYLDIHEMWSIERDENSERAIFNRPYECIKVLAGPSSQVLRDIPAEDWVKPAVAWFDYDGPLDEDSLTDSKTFLGQAKAGSILIVSVNANRPNYRGGTTENPEPALATLKNLLGTSVPAHLPKGNRKDVTAEEFPEVLAECLLSYFSQSVRISGRSSDGYQDRFIPLFALRHCDNAPMCTVGGMVASWKQMRDLERLFSKSVDEMTSGVCALRDEIDLIPITTKEKLALDSMLPHEGEGFLDRVERAGIKLDDKMTEKYRRLYRHFPLFLEALV